MRAPSGEGEEVGGSAKERGELGEQASASEEPTAANRGTEAACCADTRSSTRSASKRKSNRREGSCERPKKGRRRERAQMQRNGRVAHFSQAESHSREEGDAIWICGVCTLENPLKHLQCGACTAERPEVYGDIEKELDDTGNDDDANGRTDTAEEAAGPEEEVSREGVKSKWTKQKDWYDNVEVWVCRECEEILPVLVKYCPDCGSLRNTQLP